MSKTKIEFTRDNKDYTLEFTADSLKKMEKRGFSFNRITDRLASAPEEIFCGLFIEHHDDVLPKVREEIYHELSEMEEGGESIDDVSMVMLNEAIEELRQHKGNIAWRVKK